MRSFWCRAIPRSTSTWATPTGAWGASSMRISSGATHSPSVPMRRQKRSFRRNSRAAWNPVATRPEMVRVHAPAKINLFLHVTGKRPDGFHDLQSLVAFADVGDVLLLERRPD